MTRRARRRICYDAWGKVISSSGTLAGINPLRYRGYYFDMETGLYYLNSRYYDPATGRFLNADGSTNTSNGFLGLNMFAYCLNNPVQMKDSDGRRPAAISDSKQDKAAAYAEWVMGRTGKIPANNPYVSSSSSSSKHSFANYVEMSHVSKSYGFNFGPLIGKIQYTITQTINQSKKLGLFHAYTDVGNDATRYGVGINIWDQFGLGAGVSSQGNGYANIQITPWAHGEISIGVDGIGISAGWDYNDTSHDIEINAGWFIALFPVAVNAYSDIANIFNNIIGKSVPTT